MRNRRQLDLRLSWRSRRLGADDAGFRRGCSGGFALLHSVHDPLLNHSINLLLNRVRPNDLLLNHLLLNHLLLSDQFLNHPHALLLYDLAKAGKITYGRSDQTLQPRRRPLTRSLAFDARRHIRAGVYRLRVEVEELADDGVGLEVDELRVGADEGSAENTGRPMRHVVPFQTFQQRQADLRLVGNRSEGDLLAFTLLAQSGAETLGHGADLAGQGKRAGRNGVGVYRRESLAVLIAHEGRSPRTASRARGGPVRLGL